MNIREVIMAIGCSAVALFLSGGKVLRAGDLQTQDGPAAPASERCFLNMMLTGKAISCERIGGHLRIESGAGLQGAQGSPQPGASPVAVRMEDGAEARGHLRLPAGQPGNGPFPR